MWGRPESVRQEFRADLAPVAVARVAALVPDLLFGSKVAGRARAGRPRGRPADAPSPTAGRGRRVDVLVVDLTTDASTASTLVETLRSAASCTTSARSASSPTSSPRSASARWRRASTRSSRARAWTARAPALVGRLADGRRPGAAGGRARAPNGEGAATSGGWSTMPSARLPVGPAPQRRAVERPERPAVGREERADRVELARDLGAVAAAPRVDERRDRRRRVGERLLVAAAQRADRRARPSARRSSSVCARDAQDELGVGRARRSRRRGRRASPGAGGAARRPRRSRTRSPRRRGGRAAPATASKPIVDLAHRLGSPPSPATIERSTASSLGSR